MSATVTVFKVLTLITTLLMRVSLFPDWNRWRKNRNTADMSVWPCVMIFGNSYGSLYYAYAIENYLPLFATSMLGVAVGLFMAHSFYLWATDRSEVIRIFRIALTVLIVVTIYDFLALCGVTGQSKHSTEITLGFIMIAFTTLMYASPMATIIRVVKTKTATSMPFTMGLVNVLNSFCWGVYGGLIHNNFLLIPNIIGVTLSLIQMTVTYIYRSKGPSDEQLASTLTGDTNTIDVVVLLGEQNADEKGPGFVELRSPCGVDEKYWHDATTGNRMQ